MKKRAQRLTLNRETIVRLADDKLTEAAGGATHFCCGMSDSCGPPPSAADTSC